MLSKIISHRMALRMASGVCLAVLSIGQANAADDARLVEDIGKGAANCGQQWYNSCIGFAMSVVTGSIEQPSPEQQILGKLDAMDRRLVQMSGQLSDLQHSLDAMRSALTNKMITPEYTLRLGRLNDRNNDILTVSAALDVMQKRCRAALATPVGSDDRTNCGKLKKQLSQDIKSKILDNKDVIHQELAGDAPGMLPTSGMITQMYKAYTAQSLLVGPGLDISVRKNVQYYQQLQAMQLVLLAEYYNDNLLTYPNPNPTLPNPAITNQIKTYKDQIKKQNDQLSFTPVAFGHVVHKPTGKLWRWVYEGATYPTLASAAARDGYRIASLEEINALVASFAAANMTGRTSDILRAAWADGTIHTDIMIDMRNIVTSTTNSNYRFDDLNLGHYSYTNGLLKSTGDSYINPGPYQKLKVNLDQNGGVGVVVRGGTMFFEPPPCDTHFPQWTYSSGPCNGNHRGINGMSDNNGLATYLVTTDFAKALYVRDLTANDNYFPRQ